MHHHYTVLEYSGFVYILTLTVKGVDTSICFHVVSVLSFQLEELLFKVFIGEICSDELLFV
jgi:hypothetical protein